MELYTSRPAYTTWCTRIFTYKRLLFNPKIIINHGNLSSEIVMGREWCPKILGFGRFTTHSALELEKSAISKVQKSIIFIFKNGKKIHFCTRKKFKTTKNAIFGLKKTGFLVVLNFVLVKKI